METFHFFSHFCFDRAYALQSIQMFFNLLSLKPKVIKYVSKNNTLKLVKLVIFLSLLRIILRIKKKLFFIKKINSFFNLF